MLILSSHFAAVPLGFLRMLPQSLLLFFGKKSTSAYMCAGDLLSNRVGAAPYFSKTLFAKPALL